MPIFKLLVRRFVPALFALLAAGIGIWAWAFESPISAEDGAAVTKPAKARSSDEGTKSKKRRGAHRGSSKAVDAPKTPEFRDDVTGSTQRAPDTKASPSIDFAAQLDKAGISACRSQVNALATSTMASVEKFNTVSNWSTDAGDKRAVSLAIGQKYPDGSAVPFGVSQIISAPNQQSTCDSFLVQVLPSPLTCAKLRDSMTAQKGTQIGDLAGVALMQNGPGRTMLVPTAAGTCVLVSTRTVYGN